MSASTRSIGRVYAVIAGVTATAVVSSVVGLFASWQIADLFHTAVTDNIPSMLAAEELEIALLEQRGLVSSYLMDGANKQWLEELDNVTREFDHWLNRVRDTVRTHEQERILNELRMVFRDYQGKRKEVVQLHDRGEPEQARGVLLQDVEPLYRRAHQLCEDFTTATQHYVDREIEAGHRHIRRVTWAVGAYMIVTVGLGVALVRAFARRFRAEQARSRYEAHLAAAQQIQEHLLPGATPEIRGFDIHSVWHPAEFAAGDYYDYLRFPDGTVGVVIGDVSGHGVGPALLMASVRAYLRVFAERTTDIAHILDSANAVFSRDVHNGRFVTILLGRLDPDRRTFTYASAGHPMGYVLGASGDVKSRLESTGMPLGIDSDVSYPTATAVALSPNDVVLLVSDGVLEASSPDGELFGVRRLLEVVRAHRHSRAREIAESIYHAICAFSRSGELADDVTATVLKVDPLSDPYCRGPDA